MGNNIRLCGHNLGRGDGGGTGDRGAACVHLHLHAVLVRPLYHRRRVGGILHAAESDFTDCPDAFLRHLLEVLFYQALFKYDAAAMNLYAAGLERRERLMR